MAANAPAWTQKTAENAKHCRPPLSEAEVRRITQSVGRYSANVDPNTFPPTETGNAEFVVALYGEGLRYDHRRRRWLVWAEDWWVDDNNKEVTRLAINAARLRHHAAVNIEDGDKRDQAAKWARRSESANVVANSLDLAAALKPIADAGDCWDSDPFLLGVQNGVVDLRTGEVRSGQPEDRITKVAAVEYDQRATCPLWIQFLRRIMDGNSEMIAFLQRLGGYCLTADIREQILPIFWGQGSNGKSVFCETLLGILGPYASEAPPGLLTLTKYEDHPTEIADLQGKRVIFASETERNARLRIQLVKRLTGDRYLKGRFMRCDYFLFERTHKTILRTNNAPCVAENTVAVWRRLRLVPFRVTIPPEEEDRELASKLRAEWPGILNWLLTGCIEWQRGGLGEPPEVTQATADYRAEQDRLTDFWETRCVFQPDTFTSRADLYAAYSAWAEKAREAPMDRATLFEEVRRLSGITEYRQRQAGQIQRGFRGIGVLP
jgi:putative DNA primase/helicase